jgi:tetratricopeptide (TPR) repeat protein
LEKYASEFPDGKLIAEVYLQNAHYHYGREDYNEARKYFGLLTEKMPGHKLASEAYYWTGWAYYHQQNFAQAIDAFATITTDSWEKEDAQFRIAECLYMQEKWDEAYRRYSAFIQDYPKNQLIPEALYKMGLSLKNEGKLHEALDYLKKAIDTNAPDYLKVNCQYEIGRTYDKLNDFSRACFEYLKVAYLYPSYTKLSISSYKRAAEILEEEAKFIQAKNIYTKLSEFPEEKNFAQDKIIELNKKIAGE